MNQKGWSNKATIILIAILLIAGYFLYGQTSDFAQPKSSTQNETSKVDETANWKTFTDSYNTFSFKYPNSWNVPKVLTQSTHTEYLFPESAFSVRVGFDYNQSLQRALSFEEELENAKKYSNKVSQVSVGGRQAQQFAYASSISVLIPYGNEIMIISTSSKKSSDIQIFDQILSTFKFLDQSAEGRFCGGIAANLPENQCPGGYKCQLDGNYPDAGGKCVKK